MENWKNIFRIKFDGQTKLYFRQVFFVSLLPIFAEVGPILLDLNNLAEFLGFLEVDFKPNMFKGIKNKTFPRRFFFVFQI